MGLLTISNHRKHCNDDILTFNTQTSSQWDGFRHFPYQNFPGPGEYRFYNGLTMEEAKDPKVIRNGIQSERCGVPAWGIPTNRARLCRQTHHVPCSSPGHSAIPRTTWPPAARSPHEIHPHHPRHAPEVRE